MFPTHWILPHCLVLCPRQESVRQSAFCSSPQARVSSASSSSHSTRLSSSHSTANYQVCREMISPGGSLTWRKSEIPEVMRFWSVPCDGNMSVVTLSTHFSHSVVTLSTHFYHGVVTVELLWGSFPSPRAGKVTTTVKRLLHIDMT